MSTLAYILLFSFLSSVASMIGGVVLLAKRSLAQRLSHLLASFAAGALLGTAFFDLLPEALEGSENTDIFVWALLGLLLFFILERFLDWFHHHHEHATDSVVPLVVFGDTVHNFIDGLVVGGAFVVDIKLGIVTALATAAHEIPQEIGDFGILLNKGIAKNKVFFYNFFSALATIVGALLIYLTAGAFESLLPFFLALTAGFFIYIAASDLIPEIHSQEKKSFAFLETSLLLMGAGVVWMLVKLLEG